MNIRVIDPKLALKHGYRRPANYLFAQKQPMVPVQIAEIASIIATLPLAFAKMPDDRYIMVAVTGSRDGRNLLVDDTGRWGASYIPNNYRAYPFTLQNTTGDQPHEHRFSLCFDHESGLYREHPDSKSGDIAFFDENGQACEVLQKAAQFLSQNVARQSNTQKAVDAIVQADLLMLWELPLTDNQDPYLLPHGIYRINESKLALLTNEEIIKLFRSQSMPLIYAQLLSTTRTSVLRELAKRHNSIAEASKLQKLSVETKDIAQMFGGQQGEILKFDWMK